MFPRVQDFWANSCFLASMTLLRSLVLLYVCKTKQYYIVSIVLSLIGSAMYWFFTCFRDLGVYISRLPVLVFFHTPAKEDSVSHPGRAWNRGKVSKIYMYVHGLQPEMHTSPKRHPQVLCCLASLLPPRQRQYQLYAPTVSCNPSWQQLSISVKEQSTFWQLVSYSFVLSL